MKISIIAAMAQNGVIGKNNKLPWALPDDLKRFKAITSGHPVIMGRKTFESIGHILSNRLNIIISRQTDFKVSGGAAIVSSLEEAIAFCKKQEPEPSEVFVIGGAQLYKVAIKITDRIYLTLIHRDFDGDVFFPKFDAQLYHETSREDRDQPIPYSYLVFDRVDNVFGA